VNKVIPGTNFPVMRLMINITRLLLEGMKIVLASMLTCKSLKRRKKAFRKVCMNCVNHMLKLTNIWKNIYTNKREPKDVNECHSTCSLKKIHVLGYEYLKQKEQDHARMLPKGIYVENIMSQIWILRSATTISPSVQTVALSDIDINSPPANCRETKNPRPKHVQKNPTLAQQKNIAGQKIFLSKQKVTPMSSTTLQKKSILVYKIQTFY
jgi:hypothetical protein